MRFSGVSIVLLLAKIARLLFMHNILSHSHCYTGAACVLLVEVLLMREAATVSALLDDFSHVFGATEVHIVGIHISYRFPYLAECLFVLIIA